MGDVENSENPPGERRGSRRDSMWAIIILGGGTLLLALVLLFPWFDTLNQQWVRCDVVDAQPQRGSNYNTVAWFVSIETSDCGFLTYEGVTSQEDVRQLAETIPPGPYEFKMGMLSQLATEVELFDRAAEAKDFRPVAVHSHVLD